MALIAALGLFAFVLKPALASAPLIAAKLRGDAPYCPWSRIFSFVDDNLATTEARERVEAGLELVETDESLGLEKYSYHGRAFWAPKKGDYLDGRKTIALLVADHDAMAVDHPEQSVQPGDIVIDVGAHIGVFTRKAVDRGAAKVIAIEPAPLTLECLRRNLAAEIASGKVVVVPKGAWSVEDVLHLSISDGNTGENSFVLDRSPETIEIPVTTIDLIVDRLGLARVDYIKIDIEGAEREAFKGAVKTLRDFRPTLMVDSYHREDDMEVLPKIIRSANEDYVATCGRCEPGSQPGKPITPHIVFYR